MGFLWVGLRGLWGSLGPIFGDQIGGWDWDWDCDWGLEFDGSRKARRGRWDGSGRACGGRRRSRASCCCCC